MSGWINEDFIVEINRVLNEKRSENKFYQFWANDSFAQEVGFFFAGKTLSDQIYDYASKHNEKVSEYGLPYQLNDGEREEGFDDF